MQQRTEAEASPGRYLALVTDARAAPARFALAAIALAACVPAFAYLLVGATPVALGTAALFYGVAAMLALTVMARGHTPAQVGPCNVVTLSRLALTSALIAPLLAPGTIAWVLALAILALILDGADGWLARHFGHESAFGARFDMEVDSAFGLVLALGAVVNGSAGLAALLLGLPRYLFVLAAQVWPWLDRPLPERRGRKTVCVLQIAALITLQVPSLPGPTASAIVLAALGALAWSFGRDVLWLRTTAA